MARRQRRNYAQVASTEDEEQNIDAEVGANETSQETRRSSHPAESSSLITAESSTENTDDGSDTTDSLTVIILDCAQKKFSVKLQMDATVAKLKRQGAKVHKVSADRQRLIYRGQMLQDEKTLEESGITTDNTIIHLFPKPRVVIKDSGNNTNNSIQQDSESESTDNNNDNSPNDEGDEEEGARVPTIVLDADEAERRSQILVLGSADYLEAQNNVKLFSFMLLIISTIELMTLLGIALGVPQEDDTTTENGVPPTVQNGYEVTIDDDILGPASSSDGLLDDGTYNVTGLADVDSSNLYSDSLQEWTIANWFDLAISLAGVYVGILGLQASSLNTLKLAKLYMTGTVLTGIAWMLFNYFMTYEMDKEAEESREENQPDDKLILTDSDIRWQAVTVMILPGMVWVLCCLRAWQFQHLISEAEQEAEERIRSEFASVARAAGGIQDDEDEVSDDDDSDMDAQQTTTEPNQDEELALQNDGAHIS